VIDICCQLGIKGHRSAGHDRACINAYDQDDPCAATRLRLCQRWILKKIGAQSTETVDSHEWVAHNLVWGLLDSLGCCLQYALRWMFGSATPESVSMVQLNVLVCRKPNKVQDF